MAEPDALCEPIATTSLYENEGLDKSTVLTLEASKAEYAELQSPADDTVHAYRETAPFIVVQLRKRRGKVEVFLDGHLSEGKKEKRGDGTALVHDLYWHNGMHEDAEARTRVLSPIAVACAVEDGQRSIRNVKVSVWQSYLGLQDAVPWQLLSESNLSPHRVSDTRCRVSTVPYPLAYHRKPTVTIIIDRKGRQQRALNRWTAISAWLQQYVTKGPSNINPNTSQEDFKDAMKFKAVSAITGGILLNMVANIFSNKAVHFATAAVAAAIKLNVDIGDMNLANGNNENAEVSGTKAQLAVSAGLTVLTTVVNKYFSGTREPPPTSAAFTLPEFARTIEVIAAVLSSKPPDDTDIEVQQAYIIKQQSLYGRNERLLWDWMASPVEADHAERAELQSADLLFKHVLGTQLHIVIDVKDTFECEAGTSRHELRCKRNDAYYLSSAASGTLDDLKRISEALEQCRKVLITTPDRNAMQAAVNTAKNVIAGFFRASRNKFKQLQTANNSKGALGTTAMNKYKTELMDQQTRTLKTLAGIAEEDRTRARAALVQFEKCFKYESGNGKRLQRRIEAALLAKGRPSAVDTPVCTRLLPQRVGRSNFIYMFRSGQQLSTQHVEMAEDLGSVIREFSEYHDASQSLQLAMKSGFAYLRRFAPQWESRAATRVTLSCMCKKVPGFENVKENAGAPLCSTLAITTPVDIHFAMAVSRFTEASLRRIRFVVKRAQQKCDPSFLEALGLKHTSEDLLACQVFGDLWADELIALHQSGEAQCPQMQMLEQASRRAASRLRALGTLLLELFTVLPQAELTTDDENEIAPEVSDVAFRATLAGRDAALLIGKLLFTRDDFEMRSVMTPIVRQSAAAAVRAAATFERNVPVHLPHEPLASLFGPRSECVAAFVRAGKLMRDDVAARRAIVAAYASARLLSNDEHNEALALLEAHPQTPWRDPPKQSVKDLLASMRHRMASLRMDYDPLDVAENLNTLNIHDTTSKLVVAEDYFGYAFYVPFGLGNARPAPTLPPVPAPMFGSVPVMGMHLKAAFESIASVLNGGSPTDVAKSALRVHLMPQLRCTPALGEGVQETNSMHPNVVQVRKMTTDERIEVHFSASRSRSNRLKLDSTDGPEDSKVLADAHKCRAATLEMAHEVSSIAWNAERVAQCVMAALASKRDMNGMDTVCIELTIPDHTEYLESWYNKRPQEKLDEARRNIEEKVQALHMAQQQMTNAIVARENSAKELAEFTKAHDTQTVDGKELSPLDNDPTWERLNGALENADGNLKTTKEAHEGAKNAKDDAGDNLVTLVRNVAEAKESTKRSQRLLLGSVGVGMAMLSALLLPIRVELKGPVLLSMDVDAITAVKRSAELSAERYAECEAVRLSEACLVISQLF